MFVKNSKWVIKMEEIDDNFKRMMIRIDKQIIDKVVVGYAEASVDDLGDMFEDRTQYENGWKKTKANEYKTIFPNGSIDKA